MFNPNIKLDQEAMHQKSLNESILFSPELSLVQESLHNYTNIDQQEKLNGQDFSLRNKTINQLS